VASYRLGHWRVPSAPATRLWSPRARGGSPDPRDNGPSPRPRTADERVGTARFRRSTPEVRRAQLDVSDRRRSGGGPLAQLHLIAHPMATGVVALAHALGLSVLAKAGRRVGDGNGAVPDGLVQLSRASGRRAGAGWLSPVKEGRPSQGAEEPVDGEEPAKWAADAA